MVGPPISIFSIAFSNVQFFLETASSNGYKLTATISINSYVLSFKFFKDDWSFAKIPACIFGCKVFTLPSRISSNFVKSDMDIFLIFFDVRNLAVPPVDRII